MDRTIQTRREAETSNQYAVRDFVYNNVGLLQRESLPYFSSGSSRTTATATSSLYTTYAYDALRRATTTATAVGTTTHAYDDWTTTITDPNGNIKKLTNDAYSRLATVVEKNGTTFATTTYAWNANDTLGDDDGCRRQCPQFHLRRPRAAPHRPGPPRHRGCHLRHVDLHLRRCGQPHLLRGSEKPDGQLHL